MPLGENEQGIRGGRREGEEIEPSVLYLQANGIQAWTITYMHMYVLYPG